MNGVSWPCLFTNGQLRQDGLARCGVAALGGVRQDRQRMVIHREVGKRMVMSYKFINPSLWKGVTADEAAAELDRIRQKNGVLKPEIVIDESRDENAVLHRCFQWDNEKAAELWRREQARKLIGNITCVVIAESVESSVRAFVCVETSNNSAQSYIPITEAIVDDTAYQDLLRQARADMDSFIKKYTQITELRFVKQSMLRTMDYIDRECIKSEK